jgi:hypothetical protein
MKNRLIYTTFFLTASLLLMQCKKSASLTQTETDAALFAKASSHSGFTYYKGDSTIYHASAPSAHHGYIRVRFNTIALSALTDGGKLPVGGAFPTGSLVVKELHGDSLGTGLFGFAIMEKLPTDSNQASGWVWGEYNLSMMGTTVDTKGAQCTGCHSVDDRDMVRVFDLFP